MRKTSLSAVERQIIETMIIGEYGPATLFLRQIGVAQIDKRRLTGVGVFVDLSIPRSAPRVDAISAELSAGFRTSFSTPADVVGFTLFIRDGAVSFLEGYTYGDAVWPEEPLDEWLILDPVEAPHQKAK
ncbi:MAG TPA: hypothetical protein VG308_08665 [Stellaceae bacterium]|jgi:hypothetical protein|nr:hypothetical protein [Stellaceae bacterium]